LFFSYLLIIGSNNCQQATATLAIVVCGAKRDVNDNRTSQLAPTFFDEWIGSVHFYFSQYVD